MQKPILITGPAGSGKSHLCQYLNSQGIVAVDMDTVQGLSAWMDSEGHTVEYPESADADWIAEHAYRWNRDVLEAAISQKDASVFLGLSDDDATEFADLFAAIVYLHVPSAIIDERLKERENHYGRTKEQRKAITRAVASFDEKAKRNGYYVIDADKDSKDIWKSIKNMVHGA
jgi:adenylate kinase family enzyme